MKEESSAEKDEREAHYQYMQANIPIFQAWGAYPGVMGAYDYWFPDCIVKSLRMSDFRGLFD